MEWTTFSAGKNQDDVILHKNFLQGGRTLYHEFSYRMSERSLNKDDNQFLKYFHMYLPWDIDPNVDNELEFTRLLNKKIYKTLGTMNLLYDTSYNNADDSVITIAQNFNEEKYIYITVQFHNNNLRFQVIITNLDYDVTPWNNALEKILHKILSIIDSIQSLEKIFLTNSKYYENHSILLDSFDRNPDPRDDGASMLNNVLLFSIYNQHKDIISKQVKNESNGEINTQPLTGKRLKELLVRILRNPDIGYI